MDQSLDSKPRASLSDYLAAERTLLAWIRTGLALMGFGFVVARFGLFLQQLQLVRGGARPQRVYGLSLWLGTALIAVGIVVNVLPGFHHLQLVRRLDHGDTSSSHSTTQAVAVALVSRIGWGCHGGLSCHHSRLTGSSRDEQRRIAWHQAKDNGIITIPSNHSVDETVGKLKGILDSKRRHALRACRSQRRSRKSWTQDASDQAAHLRQSKGGYACHACCAQHRHRPSAQDSRLGRRERQGLWSPTTVRSISRSATTFPTTCLRPSRSSRRSH